MVCKRCGNKLIGKQISYCSGRCSKLHLKSLYRRRNREKINAYNRAERKRGIRGNPSTNNIIADFKRSNPTCAKCGSVDIQVAHIKPRHMGGKNRDNLISLCRKHHHQFDEVLKQFWHEKI